MGERVFGDDQIMNGVRRAGIIEQHLADAAVQRRVAREPSGGVHARRHGHGVGQIDPAMARAQSVDPAKARRQAHRSAGIAAEREITQSGRDHRDRPG